MMLSVAHPASRGVRRGAVVQAARARPVLQQPLRRALIPLCTAAPGSGKGDAQSRRRNATPRVEPVSSDPLTEAAAKQTNRLKKELKEVQRPPAPAPAATQPESDPEWEAWEEYFASCDRAAYLISALEWQKDAAVRSERFGEATSVRSAIAAIEDKDGVQGLLRALDDAIKAERFAEAAKLRDLGPGLVGWWAGRHEPRDPLAEEADPYGCILRVSPAHGRFVGSMYAVRDLVGMQGGALDPNSGFPVLELFVQRDDSTGKESYKLQPVAVYGGAPPMDLAETVEEALNVAAMSGGDVNVEIVMQGMAAQDGKTAEELEEYFEAMEEDDDEDDFDEEHSECVLDLGDTIASLLLGKPESEQITFATFDLSADYFSSELVDAVMDKEDEEQDLLRVPATLTRLGRDAFVFEHVAPEMEDDEEDEDEEEGDEREGEGSEDEGSEEEGPSSEGEGGAYTIRDAIDDARRAGRPGPGSDWPAPGARPSGSNGREGAPEASGRGQQQSSGPLGPGGDDRGLDIQVGAGFFDKWDSVSAEIDKLEAAKDPTARRALIKAVREAAESIISSHGLPTDTKVVINGGGAPGAPSEEGGGGFPFSSLPTLQQRMRFDRLRTAPSADPFSQLYVGNFGPHGPEAIELVRGTWGDERGFSDDHVSALKVTGDENVPVGRATFRAEVGRQHKLDPSEVYPEELGVLARYRGEGRVARPGLSGAIWVEGELLVLDGVASITGGAELGFVWSIPGERRFLILFSKLKLPEVMPL